MSPTIKTRSGASSAAVLEALRSDLLAGHYHPNERLVEADLSERYGATRTAVRAALMELTSQGLVEREPNRGARVRLVTVDEAIEIAEVRLTLQALCAERAAERGSEDQKQALVGVLDGLRKAVDVNDFEGLMTANLEIAARIREMAGHETASRIIEQLLTQHVYRWFPLVLPERRVDSLRENERIVQAIAAGDAAAAKAATLDHLASLLSYLQQARAQQSAAGSVRGIV